jgi:hypothetical protein
VEVARRARGVLGRQRIVIQLLVLFGFTSIIMVSSRSKRGSDRIWIGMIITVQAFAAVRRSISGRGHGAHPAIAAVAWLIMSSSLRSPGEYNTIAPERGRLRLAHRATASLPRARLHHHLNALVDDHGLYYRA